MARSCESNENISTVFHVRESSHFLIFLKTISQVPGLSSKLITGELIFLWCLEIFSIWCTGRRLQDLSSQNLATLLKSHITLNKLPFQTSFSPFVKP